MIGGLRHGILRASHVREDSLYCKSSPMPVGCRPWPDSPEGLLGVSSGHVMPQQASASHPSVGCPDQLDPYSIVEVSVLAANHLEAHFSINSPQCHLLGQPARFS